MPTGSRSLRRSILEMSFVDQDDVIAMQEGFLAKTSSSELKGVEIQLPLPRITWDEAMERFGSDKPDTTIRLGTGKHLE